MSMMQPEALLPAPFPSTVPYRAYLYNMGVLTKHRRKGVAKALVQACMRTGASTSQAALTPRLMQ